MFNRDGDVKLPYVWNYHITDVEHVLVVNPCSDVQRIKKPGKWMRDGRQTSPRDVQDEYPSD